MAWSEDVAVEVEALQAIYGEELVLDEPQQQISMQLLPQQQDPMRQHFVQCSLLFKLPPGYPSQPPSIQLQDVRGFVNRQEQLQQQLAADGAELVGELLLGQLFAAAQAWLTEQDWPEGPCIFCLEHLAAAAAAAAADGSRQATLRLPCFHAYHEPCFAEWWCWQQTAYAQQQQALEEKTGATAAAALVQEALPPRDGAHYQLSCPTCRAPFQLHDLPQPIQQQLQQQLDQQTGGQQEQHTQTAKLTDAQLQPFLELQRRHAKLFAAQQQRQGIIDTDASYCIADWEGLASSSTAGAGGGASAAAAAAAAAAAGRGGPARADGMQGRGGGGRGRGRSRGSSQRGHRHSYSSDGSDAGDRAGRGVQQQRQHMQQTWRQQDEQQDWGPRPGRHQQSHRGRGARPPHQQQQQARDPDGDQQQNGGGRGRGRRGGRQGTT